MLDDRRCGRLTAGRRNGARIKGPDTLEKIGVGEGLGLEERCHYQQEPGEEGEMAAHGLGVYRKVRNLPPGPFSMTLLSRRDGESPDKRAGESVPVRACRDTEKVPYNDEALADSSEPTLIRPPFGWYLAR